MVVALGVLAAVAGAAPVSAAADDDNFRLEHFLCYSTTNQEFQERAVGVRDQFGPSLVRAFRRVALCNPVSKDEGQVENWQAHLVCYAVERREPFDPRRVEIFNQFEPVLLLEVGRPVLLCLPSGKVEDPEPGTHVGVPTDLDHYQCYRARSPEAVPEREVRLEDQFGRRGGITGQPGFLCNPASKRHLDQDDWPRLINETDHLVCYDLKSKPPFKPRTVVISNQFETDVRIKVVHVLPLCLPSHKREVRDPEPPDLTPVITNIGWPDCTIDGCRVTVDYRVRNQGSGPAGPFSVLASADPNLATQRTVGFAGLAPRTSTGPLSVTLGPADNCYDPNCRAMIEVDPSNAVAETDEFNNVDLRERQG